MGLNWFLFLLRLARRNRQRRADARRLDALRRDVGVRLSRAERQAILDRLAELARVAERLMAEAGFETDPEGPAKQALRHSPEVAVFRALTALRQDWVEQPRYASWTDRQLRSAELLAAYMMEADDKAAAPLLETVETKDFFRRWRNTARAAVKSGQRAQQRGEALATFDAQKAKLRALWDRRRNDPAHQWHAQADKWRSALPETGFRRAPEQAAPDPWLWHLIATDQHEMNSDRLAAVFWLLGRPECDRATAAEFIAGYALSDNFLRAAQEAAREGGQTWAFAAFCDLIDRWNSGAYTQRRISRADAGLYDEEGAISPGIRDDGYLTEFAKIHQTCGTPLPALPVNLARALDKSPERTLLDKNGPLTYDPNRRRLVPAMAEG